MPYYLTLSPIAPDFWIYKVVWHITFRGGPKAYGNHQLICCLFHSGGNIPTWIVKSNNDPPHSPKGIGTYFWWRGKGTWTKGLELLEPCQVNTTNLSPTWLYRNIVSHQWLIHVGLVLSVTYAFIAAVSQCSKVHCRVQLFIYVGSSLIFEITREPFYIETALKTSYTSIRIVLSGPAHPNWRGSIF